MSIRRWDTLQILIRLSKSQALVGSELAGFADYLLDRARSDLGLRRNLRPFFRSLAPVFIAVFGIPEIGIHLRVQHALSNLPNRVGNVVDIGCGAGMMLGQIHAHRNYRKLVGVEMDPVSCEVAQRTHPYAHFLTGDIIAKSELLAGKFDFALLLDVLQYVPDGLLRPFMGSCARTLKPGGRLIIHVPLLQDSPRPGRFSDWSQPGWMRRGFSVGSLSHLMKLSGLLPLSFHKTVNIIAARAWEWNMLAAAHPVQSLAFPLLLTLARIGESIPAHHHSCVLCIASRA